MDTIHKILVPTDDLDATCINTIRTLAMDAVQAANSGHPGTPMAMAPVAYCLWQQFLRFDPQDPIWPNRDRFVLSAGHASMLLYSLLHLTGVKAVSKDYENLGEPSVPLEAIKRFRQLDSRCPGHPEYRWTSGVETTTGPLGQGLATSVGMAIAGRWMAAHFNRPGFEDLIDFNVYALCGDGCMMEGISARGGVAGRAPAALQSLLDLRQQPHHHRGPHRAGLQRRRGHPLPRLRLERHPRRRRQRPGNARPGLPHLPEDDGPAHADHRGQPHRLRRAAQAGHQRRPRRAAGRGRNPPDQTQLRLAGGRQVLCPGRRLRALPATASASAARSCATPGSRSVNEYRAKYPELADQLYRMQHRQLPEGWDKDMPTLPGRRQRHGHARFVRQGAQRRGEERALADRRLGRPGPVHQDAADVRGRRRFLGGQSRRAQPALRHPRARHGRDPQRHGPGQGAALRLELPDLQRLRPRGRFGSAP